MPTPVKYFFNGTNTVAENFYSFLTKIEQKSKTKFLPHFGTSQYSHLVIGSVVKHHGPSRPLDPGLRQ